MATSTFSPRAARAPLVCAAAIGSALAGANARADSPLASLAHVLAHDLGTTSDPMLVIASPLHTDVAAPRGDELSQRVASLVAAAMGGAATAGSPASLPVARSLARGRAALLLFLDVRVEAGELRVTADLFPRGANVWDRVRAAGPREAHAPSSHAYAHVKLAAEVRSYLAPLHLERASVSRFSHDLGPVLAVACGDVDGVDGNELLLVTAREVAWGHLASNPRRFVVARRADASHLAPLLPVPTREPFALAAIADSEPATRDVGWGDRVAVSLTADLAPLAALDGLPVRAGASVACMPLDAPRGALGRSFTRCDARRPVLADAPDPLESPVDAWSSLALTDASGRDRRVVALHEPAGPLRIRVSERGTTPVDLVAPDERGAELALGDLDEDGAAEVVSALASSDDAVVIETVRGGKLEPRFRVAAPAGVDAVAVCPPESGDLASVIAVVGREVWVVR